MKYTQKMGVSIQYLETRQIINMKTYYIIDSLGVRHATIKANSDIEAINIYKEGMPKFIEYIVIAVRPEEISLLIKNIKNQNK